MTHSFRRGEVICDSWRDRTGPGVCALSPAAFLIMNIREEKKEREGEERWKKKMMGEKKVEYDREKGWGSKENTSK